MGLAVPKLDKLQVLARWLDVSEEWLRWGESGVGEPGPGGPQKVDSQFESGRPNLGAPTNLSSGRSSDEA